MKNFTSLAPGALLVLALAGCSHHASTASSVTAPDAGASTSNTNTFGDDKTKATGDAEHARDQSYGSGTGTSPAPAPQSDAPNTANPK